MAKAVEVQWNLTPFRSEKFVQELKPYAERAINFGATGFLLIQQADDELIVKQYAWFENKADWDRYWNSELMQECRAKLISHYAVPLLYTWQNIVTFNKFPDAAEVPTEVEA